MALPRPEAGVGVLGGRFSFVRIQRDPSSRRTLVVLPGDAVENEQRGGWVARLYARGFRRLAEGRTVYVVQRPRGLAAGTGTRDLAAEYAQVLRDELGPVDVMGLSTGGMIAQHLALDAPDVVRRLALVVTGARLAPTGRDLCVRWKALAEDGAWWRLRADLAASAVDGPALQWTTRTAVSAFGGGTPDPTDAADFRTTLDAVLGHDTLRLLPRLAVPTLVIGGGVDPFFPAATLRETAAAIPDARLLVHRSSGHGLPKHRAGPLQRQVAAFLDTDG